MNVDKLAMRYEQLKNKTRKHSFITLKDNRSAELECCRKILKFEDYRYRAEIQDIRLRQRENIGKNTFGRV